MGSEEKHNPGKNRTEQFAAIESHRSYMLRFATAKQRDTDLAEEVVQEALLAALDGIDSFSGQSALRTWLTSILRFKIIDFQRRVMSECARFTSPSEEDVNAYADWVDKMFDDTGHWQPRLVGWAAPDEALEQKRFFWFLSVAWTNCRVRPRGYSSSARHWGWRLTKFARKRASARPIVG